MPHTNRARRADHYRSIETSNTSAATSNGNQGGRRRSHHEQDDGALNHKSGGRDGPPEHHGGRSAGRGPGGRGAGAGRQGGNHGRGGGRGAETRSPAPAGGKGKSKTPSVKNRIRSLTRLMNKPVRACMLTVPSSRHETLCCPLCVYEAAVAPSPLTGTGRCVHRSCRAPIC